jgi:hypothetical protein
MHEYMLIREMTQLWLATNAYNPLPSLSLLLTCGFCYVHHVHLAFMKFLTPHLSLFLAHTTCPFSPFSTHTHFT